MTLGKYQLGCQSGCECGEPCASFSDDFNDGAIGGDWVQVAGTWSESGGLLTTASTSAVIVTTGGGIVTSKGAAFVTIPYSGGSSTTPAKKFPRLIGAYTDANNFLFVEIELDYSLALLGTYLTLRLYERSGGADTLLEESHSTYPISTYPLTVGLCWTGAYAAATASNYGFPATVKVSGPSTLLGTKAGLGTGSEATNIYFDAFSFAPTNEDGDNALCGGCRSCREICVETPDALIVTTPSSWIFSNGTCAECTSINGRSFTLTRQTDFQETVDSPFQSSANFYQSCVYKYVAELCTGYWLQVTAWPAWQVLFAIREGSETGNIVGRVFFQSAAQANGQDCCNASWSLELSGGATGSIFFGGGALCTVDDTDAPPLTLTADCYGYYGGSGSAICCDGVSLPGSLFVTITADGAPYQTDVEVTGGSSAAETYEFSNGGESITLVCQGGVDGSNAARLLFTAGVSSGEITLTVDSCDPYHATGSATIDGVLYEAEVTA